MNLWPFHSKKFFWFIGLIQKQAALTESNEGSRLCRCPSSLVKGKKIFSLETLRDTGYSFAERDATFQVEGYRFFSVFQVQFE
jgi:hypothetical protein